MEGTSTWTAGWHSRHAQKMPSRASLAALQYGSFSLRN
jgi:hypothetical protein